METYRRGYLKRHSGICGGDVIYIENTEKGDHHEWDFFCKRCQKNIYEEEVEVYGRNDGMQSRHKGK